MIKPAPKTLPDWVYYPLWKYQFRLQLELMHGLHMRGEICLCFEDFCLLAYENFPEEIDYSQH